MFITQTHFLTPILSQKRKKTLIFYELLHFNPQSVILLLVNILASENV